MTESIYRIWLRSPQEALEETFVRARARYPRQSDRAFMWTSAMGTHGECRYGSYKIVTKESLEGRKFKIECRDYAVGLYFTDVLHDPKTYKEVPNGSPTVHDVAEKAK